MKRFLCTLLAGMLALALPGLALADAFSYESIPTPHILVVDGDDVNQVFYERAADEKAYPASTTKIMTCMLAIESGSLDDTVTVGDEVTPFTNYSSLMGLKSGETVTMRDLVYGLMLVSGNDAAAAIAVHVGGSIEGFVEKMNSKAQSIGMASTHFTNPHGVQNENHYTTARDMARLMAYALQNKEFCDIDKTTEWTVPATNIDTNPKVLYTTNRMLRPVAGDPVNTVYPYAVGGKTGDTDAAGKCLVAVAERDGARVIVVLFGDMMDMYGGDKVMNNIARFVNAASIFEHVFATDYLSVAAGELNVPTSFAVPVGNGAEADLTDGKLTVTADVSGLSVRGGASRINTVKAAAAAIQTRLNADGLTAPVLKGQSVGTVDYVYENAVLFSAELIAAGDVRAAEAAPAGSAGEESPFAPTADPLIDRGHKVWSAGDVLLLVLVLLVVLLAALIVVFAITERKRRYERKRRRAKMRRSSRY